MKIHILTYESRNFTFMCADISLSNARKTIRNTLKAHATEWRLKRNWFESDGVSERTVDLGHGYRDDSCIFKPSDLEGV